LEFHGEAQVAQDLLELLLLGVATVDGIGVGLGYLTARLQLAQEHAVVEMPAMGLAHGVIQVLHIDEYGKSFQGVLRLLAPLCAVGPFVGRTTLHLSAAGVSSRCLGWRTRNTLSALRPRRLCACPGLGYSGAPVVWVPVDECNDPSARRLV